MADDVDHRADERDLNEAAHSEDQCDESGCEFHGVHVQDLMRAEEKMVSALLGLGLLWVESASKSSQKREQRSIRTGSLDFDLINVPDLCEKVSH